MSRRIVQLMQDIPRNGRTYLHAGACFAVSEDQPYYGCGGYFYELIDPRNEVNRINSNVVEDVGPLVEPSFP